MDIKTILEEQRKNWPNAEWNFLWMEIENTFPANTSFHGFMWASWLSKIREGEKSDEEYLTQRQIEFEEYSKSDEAKKHDFDPGDILADEAYEAFSVSNNIYAALVVSIWSKSEITLKRITSLAIRQQNLNLSLPLNFKSQQDFLNDNLGISVPSLPSFDEMNGIRILNNIYKHAGGKYNPDPTKPWEHFSPAVANAWSIKNNKEVDYTIIPIKELILNAHVFFSKLHEKARNRLQARRQTT
jgi:hypothetical protein